MSDLRALYQELIIDHGRKPRNFGLLTQANQIKSGYNPLCGDKITIYLLIEADMIKDIHFDGCGCAISIASASLMTEILKGKNVAAAAEIFNQFHQLVTTNDQNAPEILSSLGKLVVLAGVAAFPARVKCATLAWHTMMAALQNSTEPVTTEAQQQAGEVIK